MTLKSGSAYEGRAIKELGEEGEIMEFETVDPKWITIKLSNGIALQLKVEGIKRWQKMIHIGDYWGRKYDYVRRFLRPRRHRLYSV